MSFSSWRFKSSLRHQKLFCSYISWLVEAGAPDRQFLSSAPKFSNLYCLARGGRSAGTLDRRSAGPQSGLFGIKSSISVVDGPGGPILPTSKPAKCALCTLLAVDLAVSKIS